MIIPKKTYYKVGAALFILMFLTVAAAYLNLGPFNIYIALTIACVKAVLVVMYFMHVKYQTKVTWLFAGAGFLWIVIMFALTMSDYITRY
ncbi:MAG: cytochrome C oxidase subunit IV family protein [Ignavibacteriae bacterium]|nr:cytochrome C oxidase subunit IV family protein [Ignavibacteriota bacterium]